jgi:hypothetical protein
MATSMSDQSAASAAKVYGISRLTNSRKALKKNGQPGVGKVGDSSWYAEEVTDVSIPLRFAGFKSDLGKKTKWTFGKENEFSKHLIKSVALEMSCAGITHVRMANGTATNDGHMPYAIRVNHFPSVAIRKVQMLKYQCYMEANYMEKLIKNEEDVTASDMGDEDDDDDQAYLDDGEDGIKTYYVEKSLESARRRDYFVDLPFPFSDTDGSEFPAFLYSSGFDLEIEWNKLAMLFDNSDRYDASKMPVSTPINVDTDQPFDPKDIDVTVVFTCIRLPEERLKTLLEEYASPSGLEHKLLFRVPVATKSYKPDAEHMQSYAHASTGGSNTFNSSDAFADVPRTVTAAAGATPSSSANPSNKILYVPMLLAAFHRGFWTTFLSRRNYFNHKFFDYSCLVHTGDFDATTNEPIRIKSDPLKGIDLVISNADDANTYLTAARARGDQFYKYTTNKTSPKQYIYGMSHTRNWFDGTKLAGGRNYTNKQVALRLHVPECMEEAGTYTVWAVYEDVMVFRKAPNGGPEIVSNIQ